MKLCPDEITNFQQKVWSHYRFKGRSMPWRENISAYHVLVSELMLQQTQVTRVIPKFEAFICEFPTFKILAEAPLARVLQAWSGLGYNRRAKFLHQTAQQVTELFNGVLPADIKSLQQLPGVGSNTAGAIMAYAFNVPVVFVETNIRTVFIHNFFKGQTEVTDQEITSLVEITLDQDDPRTWYWALMDYGSALKTEGLGKIQRSKHHKKQSPFEGSLRQTRGRILRALNDAPVDVSALVVSAATHESQFALALDGLKRDGLIVENHDKVGLTGAVPGRHNE